MTDLLLPLPLALSIGLRATLLLILALTALWLFRQRVRLASAALNACLVALLLLPAIAALIPRLAVPCLPSLVTIDTDSPLVIPDAIVPNVRPLPPSPKTDEATSVVGLPTSASGPFETLSGHAMPPSQPNEETAALA